MSSPEYTTTFELRSGLADAASGSPARRCRAGRGPVRRRRDAAAGRAGRLQHRRRPRPRPRTRPGNGAKCGPAGVPRRRHPPGGRGWARAETTSSRPDMPGVRPHVSRASASKTAPRTTAAGALAGSDPHLAVAAVEDACGGVRPSASQPETTTRSPTGSRRRRSRPPSACGTSRAIAHPLVPQVVVTARHPGGLPHGVPLEAGVALQPGPVAVDSHLIGRLEGLALIGRRRRGRGRSEPSEEGGREDAGQEGRRPSQVVGKAVYLGVRCWTCGRFPEMNAARAILARACRVETFGEHRACLRCRRRLPVDQALRHGSPFTLCVGRPSQPSATTTADAGRADGRASRRAGDGQRQVERRADVRRSRRGGLVDVDGEGEAGVARVGAARRR